jgi:hypothetical protein
MAKERLCVVVGRRTMVYGFLWPDGFIMEMSSVLLQRQNASMKRTDPIQIGEYSHCLGMTVQA